MTTYTVQGFSRVLDYGTGTYSDFATARMRLVRPDDATSFVHHYWALDENDPLVGMTTERDYDSYSVTLNRTGGARYELQDFSTHIERQIYALDWGAGNTTYIHAMFEPMSGEEFIFAMSGAALPASTTLAGLNTLMEGARHWVEDGPFESGQEIALSRYQNLTVTENDRIVAREGRALFWDGGAGNDTLIGGAQNDTLHGGAGHDRLVTGTGSNVVFGGWGHDTLIAAADGMSNELFGGGGNDLITSNSIQGGWISAGAGDDVVNAGAGIFSVGFWSANYQINGGSGNDTLTAAEADDYLMGDAGNDSLTGNDGADILHGGRGIDRLYGGAGADDLNGGADNDRLYGGADSDDLFGGLGGDYMNGGTGDDLFIFRQASESTVAASDSIGGFQIGADHISLMEMDANAATTGRQQFIWQGSDAFTGRGQVRIEELAGDTIVLGNLTGGLAADFRIVIAGVTGLSVSDFLLSSE